MSELSAPQQNHDVVALSSETLHTRETMDSAGFERHVYDFGGTEVVFRGREEVPEIPGFEDALQMGAAEAPRFSDDILESGADSSKIVATQTPLGVAETALSLGIQTDETSQMVEELKQGIYSAKTLNMIDDIVAARLIGEDGLISEKTNIGAEALVLKALGGDQEAQIEVERRKSALASLDEARLQQEDNARERDPNDAEILDPDNVLLVRRTNYEPKFDEDGAVVLQNTAKETDGAYARHSIHFSLDEPVVSHMQGNWDGVKYTIVDSLGSAIVANEQKPANMLSNDTWFEMNPGEELRLPTARVFIADETHQGEPTQNGNTTTYNPHQSSVEALVSQERAVRGIESPGPGTEQHGWSLSSPKRMKLKNLAVAMGVPERQHFYSDEMKLELAFGEMIANADPDTAPEERTKKLFTGQMELDWENLIYDFEPTDENGLPAELDELEIDHNTARKLRSLPNLNHLLASCSPETRRNFYASGLSLPRAAKIKGDRVELDVGVW